MCLLVYGIVMCIKQIQKITDLYIVCQSAIAENKIACFMCKTPLRTKNLKYESIWFTSFIVFVGILSKITQQKQSLVH